MATFSDGPAELELEAYPGNLRAAVPPDGRPQPARSS